jgi:hypothetical protein
MGEVVGYVVVTGEREIIREGIRFGGQVGEIRRDCRAEWTMEGQAESDVRRVEGTGGSE